MHDRVRTVTLSYRLGGAWTVVNSETPAVVHVGVT
jgi:hypothetical protein